MKSILSAMVVVVVTSCGVGTISSQQTSSSGVNRSELQNADCFKKVTDAACDQNGKGPVDPAEVQRDLQACLKDAGLPQPGGQAPQAPGQPPKGPDAPPKAPTGSAAQACFDNVMKAAQALQEKWAKVPPPKDAAEAKKYQEEIQKEMAEIRAQAAMCRNLVKPPDIKPIQECFDNVKKAAEAVREKWSKVPQPKDEAEAKKYEEEIQKDMDVVQAEAQKCEALAKSMQP